MQVSVAVVVPVAGRGLGLDGQSDLVDAAAHVREARRLGAELVCFPETYPGRWRRPIGPPPLGALQEMARSEGVFLIGGFVEPIDDSPSTGYNTAVLISPTGEEIGRYRRTSPAHGPWIYSGGPNWDFDWVPASELPVFETEIGTIGILICSEVYVPELARALVLKGAQIICMPTGLTRPGGPLFETWRTLAWARAIENHAYVCLSSNALSAEGSGLAMICSPEEILLEEYHPGVHCATLDLDRVDWLRAQHDGRQEQDDKHPAWRTKPGLVQDWRREEIFASNPVLRSGSVVGNPLTSGDVRT